MATIEERVRKDGSKGYRVKWRYGGSRNGAPQSVTYSNVEDAKSMKGAVEALRHLVYAEDPRVQTFELVTGQRPTIYAAPVLEDVGNQYIDSRVRANPDSRDTYRMTLRRFGALLRRPIDAIGEDDLQKLFNGIADGGGSPLSLYELASAIFKYAANKGMLPNGNPMVNVGAPRKRERSENFLSDNEAALLLDTCVEVLPAPIGKALRVFVEVLLSTGMRRSEALGLIVADVHIPNLDNYAMVDDAAYEGAYLLLEKQLSRSTRRHRKPERVTLKTRGSRRRIVLDVDTARVFAWLISGKRPDEPVFPDSVRGGWWLQPRVNRAWAQVVKAARQKGLAKSPRIHDLRHTHAAWLLTDGVPLLAVSRRLGHETVATTADVYGHLLPESDDVVRDSIDRRLFKPRYGTNGPRPTRPAGRPATPTRTRTRRSTARNRIRRGKR